MHTLTDASPVVHNHMPASGSATGVPGVSVTAAETRGQAKYNIRRHADALRRQTGKTCPIRHASANPPFPHLASFSLLPSSPAPFPLLSTSLARARHTPPPFSAPPTPPHLTTLLRASSSSPYRPAPTTPAVSCSRRLASRGNGAAVFPPAL
jgi:hypothetical protein